MDFEDALNTLETYFLAWLLIVASLFGGTANFKQFRPRSFRWGEGDVKASRRLNLNVSLTLTDHPQIGRPTVTTSQDYILK